MNGAAALAVLQAHPGPDLMILDPMMPVLSGWEVLEAIGMDESLRRLPILVVSAIRAPVAGLGEHGGGRMSLPKPVDAEVLLKAVHEAVADSAQAPGGEEHQGATR